MRPLYVMISFAIESRVLQASVPHFAAAETLNLRAGTDEECMAVIVATLAKACRRAKNKRLMVCAWEGLR